MKRIGNLFDCIAERDNLRLACYKALRGKRSRSAAREFGQQAMVGSIPPLVEAGRLIKGKHRRVRATRAPPTADSSPPNPALPSLAFDSPGKRSSR